MGKKAKRSPSTGGEGGRGTAQEKQGEVPALRPIALLCADIHLSLNPPVVRSAEPNWFDAMRRPLDQIRVLQDEMSEGRDRNIPVLCAGDVFDRWNSGPELINFALDALPDEMWCVPGQHDLPLHNYDDVCKSAYWTLVAAGKIIDMNWVTDKGHYTEDSVVFGYPWNHALDRPDKLHADRRNVAVIHRYCWTGTFRHPNAGEDGHCSEFQEQMKGFDLLVCGDNHQTFFKRGSDGLPSVWNCGSLMRRKSDEIVHRPSVGILMSDGTVKRHALDCSEDKFLEDVAVRELLHARIDLTEFIDELSGMESMDVDFVEVVHRFLSSHRVDKDVARLILEVVEHAQGK